MNQLPNELFTSLTGQGTQAAFSALLSESTDGVVIWSAIRDEQGQIVDFKALVFNKAAISNIPVEQFRASTFKQLFPESSSVFDQYVQVVEKGIPFRATRPFTVGSQTFWFDVSGTKLDDSLLVIFKDISSQMTFWKQLEQQAGLLQQIFNVSAFSISYYEAIRDEQGAISDFRITLLNDESRQLSIQNYGYNVTGHTLRSILRIETDSVYFQDKVKVIETGQPTRVTRYYANVDRWYDTSMVKLNDGLVATFWDVTEHKRLTEQLERSNESLEQFAYVASHDLQEPLRKVQSFSELLTNQYKGYLDENGLDLLNRMNMATRRMQELVRDILTYSRLSSQQASPKIINLNAVINDVLNDLETVIQDKRAVIMQTNLPTIPGDPTQIRQLFYNLLTNALKFTKQIPRITIEAHPLTGKELPAELMLSSYKDYTALSISDNGIGFDEQYSERIFLPFQRLNGRAQYAGSGIGLAICKRVVENHHGGILVRSQPGEGSTFTIYLPTISE